MYFIGIDTPGRKTGKSKKGKRNSGYGAISILGNKKNEVHVFRRSNINSIKSFLPDSKNVRIHIELGCPTKRKEIKDPFLFEEKGFWIGFFVSLGVRRRYIKFVHPCTWQGKMFQGYENIFKKGTIKKKRDTKKMSKRIANDIFPDLCHKLTHSKPTADMEDSLLIAFYGKIKYYGGQNSCIS